MSSPNEVETVGDIHGDIPGDTLGDTQGDTHDGGDEPSQSTQPKKRKAMEKRSDVWDHFNQYEDKNKNLKAKCVHCGSIFGGDPRNGTTTLSKHVSKCKKLPKSGDLKQSQLIFPSGQSSSLSSWSFNQEEVRNALAYMIIVDELPFKFVEREGFQHFVSKACPNFKIPSRWTVSRDCFKLYEELSKMSKNMKDKFDKYWGDPKKMNKLIFMAVVVDPRYKLKWVKLALSSMYGVELGNSIAKEVEDELVAMCGDYKQPIVTKNIDENETGEIELPSVELEDDTLQIARRKLGSIYQNFHHKDGNDIHKFLKEDTESGGPKFDILAWWKLNESKYPVLSQVARDILAVPVSTVASESAFSTGGRVLDPFRSSLSPKVVEFLVCGQDWLRKSSTPIDVEEILQDVEKIEEGIQNLSLQASTN